MNSKIGLKFTALWTNGVYFIHQSWDRLRVRGIAKGIGDDFAEITFLPYRQTTPALDERTDPQMKDPVLAEILQSYNTVYDLCEFIDFPYRCNILEESSASLIKHIKYLLRISNNSYPNLFPEIKDFPSSLEIISKDSDPYPGNISVLDIHAYENCILISGGPIANSDDWPKGYAVREVDYPWWSYCGTVGEDIILASSIGDMEIGDLVKSVWKAKKNTLPKV